MRASRRLFLGLCAATPALGALRAVPALAAPFPARVTEVWGLTCEASGGLPAPMPRTRQRRVPAGWHPDFS